jgi:1-acyl-sn-glycerol-3-phosphate acyltransferase
MFYWPTIYLLRFLFAVFTRFRVVGKQNIPKSGSFLLISNHISHFDPPVFSAACHTRGIDWMGSEILFRSRISNFYFRNSHVIKVQQYKADQQALREAVRRIRSERNVGLFPEGGIRAGDSSILGSNYKLYEGAFMIAMLSKAPILPCLVVGSDRLYNPRSILKRPPIWVRIGKPIQIQGTGRDEVHRLREETTKAIRALAQDLRETGELVDDDWPQTPQQRNPKIPAPAKKIEN